MSSDAQLVKLQDEKSEVGSHPFPGLWYPHPPPRMPCPTRSHPRHRPARAPTSEDQPARGGSARTRFPHNPFGSATLRTRGGGAIVTAPTRHAKAPSSALASSHCPGLPVLLSLRTPAYTPGPLPPPVVPAKVVATCAPMTPFHRGSRRAGDNGAGAGVRTQAREVGESNKQQSRLFLPRTTPVPRHAFGDARGLAHYERVLRRGSAVLMVVC